MYNVYHKNPQTVPELKNNIPNPKCNGAPVIAKVQVQHHKEQQPTRKSH